MHLTEIIKQHEFIFTCEIMSPKGVNIQKLLDDVDLVKRHVHAINVADNQRAMMRAGASAVSHVLKNRGIEPIMELAARNRNCLAIQSELLGASILGIENVLLHDGYDPSVGDHANAKPVYDLDCMETVCAAKMLTEGRDYTGNSLDGSPNFCIGVVAMPGIEPLEEQITEVKKKVENGAQFIQTQAVYRPDVLEHFVKSLEGLKVPIIAGHMMLKSASMASFMNSNIPGISVPETTIMALEGLPRAQVIEKSLLMSVKLLKELKPMCQGIYFMPEGWERYIPMIVDEIR